MSTGNHLCMNEIPETLMMMAEAKWSQHKRLSLPQTEGKTLLLKITHLGHRTSRNGAGNYQQASP